MRKEVHILGSRGIPAAHSGFEYLAEHLAVYLADKGWTVTVYCQISGKGAVYEDDWHGIHRVNIPIENEGALGTIFFDWKATLISARGRGTMLTLGYNTAIFGLVYRLLGKRNVINMDGIEYRRAKWGPIAKAWFYLNDWLGCWLGNQLVADHPEIMKHLESRVSAKKISMIPYGADEVVRPDVQPARCTGAASRKVLHCHSKASAGKFDSGNCAVLSRACRQNVSLSFWGIMLKTMIIKAGCSMRRGLVLSFPGPSLTSKLSAHFAITPGFIFTAIRSVAQTHPWSKHWPRSQLFWPTITGLIAGYWVMRRGFSLMLIPVKARCESCWSMTRKLKSCQLQAPKDISRRFSGQPFWRLMRQCYERSRILVSIFTAQQTYRCSQDNRQVQPDAPIINVLDIVSNTLFHFVMGIGLAPEAVYLRQTGYPGLYLVTKHIAEDFVTIGLVQSDRVGARPDNRHVAG